MNNFNQNQFQGQPAQSPMQNNFPQQSAKTQSPSANPQNTSQPAVSQVSSPVQISDQVKQGYANIFNNYGQVAADNWLKQQMVSNHVNIQAENDALIRQLDAQYPEIFSVPVVREAIMAFIAMNIDLTASLKDQGFQDAMQHIANIYNAGYQSALSLKNHNDAAKARMTSAVNSSAPHYQSNKVFTRSEIKAMSPDDFVRNEKAIFDQLNRGLIK